MMPAVRPSASVNFSPGESPGATLGSEMIAAYAAAFARVLSWLVILGVIWRVYGPDEMAAVAMVRAMLSLLNYALLGIGPAALFYLASRTDTPNLAEPGWPPPATALATALPTAPTNATPAEIDIPLAQPAAGPSPAGPTAVTPVLDYAAATPPPRAALHVARYLVATYQLMGFVTVLSLLPIGIYALSTEVIHQSPAIESVWVLALALAMLARFIGDAYGSAAAGLGLLLADSRRVFMGEIAATALFVLVVILGPGDWEFAHVFPMAAYAVGMYLLCQWRALLLLQLAPRNLRIEVPAERRDLLRYGSGVTLSQLADFLYAPAAFLLIDRFFVSEALAWYAPAAQLDAALILLVGAPAAVLLARGALAHGRGDREAIRRHFIRGSLACFGVLAGAALVVYFAAPYILTLWLGRADPVTLAILPLVLLHTVLGGAGGIARSTLLAMGRVRDYTIAALVGGVLNVLLAIILIQTTDLGLYAIPLATCISVGLRCLLWQPLLVLRALRRRPG